MIVLDPTQNHTDHSIHQHTETLDGTLELYTLWCLEDNVLIEYQISSVNSKPLKVVIT